MCITGRWSLEGDATKQQGQVPLDGPSQFPGPTSNNNYNSSRKKYEPSWSNIFKTTEDLEKMRKEYYEESNRSSELGRDEIRPEGQWERERDYAVSDLRDASFYNR